ncbi:alpha-1,6-mannosylglycoprotein 6-beta-N-acetylglucosaminyltransferase A [Lethenteron reissneri]|uniref:alpha-1,6-mannosylglycoprotein 6-beta-N-acetylglucosaminyltransferase A n=1 Tax=Lethenteron reissneri TaxID=7753 RepID=UPI002AB6AD31|nr:alpha-1,6-mannosylglycoprotein 6-beta-N-acetylglucosaminyltransferase A [Lethenteron reissneri]XP_061413704.1 alpha-1,6-mannosylglycoprotein 6-beta-N-acetylglucosaminyltransferase A [Lethenteron reissneri]
MFPWRKLSSHKLGFFLVTFGFIWGMMLLHFTIQQHSAHRPTSAELQEQILQLSKQYVKRLAEETRSTVDGPYAGTATGYDLKKTLAVLLDNILQRVGKLEAKVDFLYNGTRTNASNTNHSGLLGTTPASSDSRVNAAGLINGVQEECKLQSLDDFPHCETKLQWMKDMWQSDTCYGSFGVDGSLCSFIIYLSEVETWCPQLPWRKKVAKPEGPLAEVKTDFKQLFHRMASREEFRWMKMRILRMEESWLAAVRSLSEEHDLQGRTRKKILVHLGLLTKESGFKIAESAFSGGPLGELVQWGDVISALYLLGHHIKLSVSVSELREVMKRVAGVKSGCPVKGEKVVDLIYIDIVGLTQFKKAVGPPWVHYQCMLRVLDSFGTEPEFNHAQYAQSRGHKTPWGKWSLVPRQFYTMFPHTPDNSFLGFVVEQHLNSSDAAHMEDVKRQNQSLVYGKVDNFWKGKMQYLDIIGKYTEIHGTVHGATVNVPPYVKNHGILSGRELQFLLRETKLFVGLGFPYEGPAPLEAIANGCVFLNPRFRPPKSSKNTDFFKGKPTLRELTSQHPYAEVYIGKPHVWTIDIDDPQEVEAAVRQIVAQKTEPYMPYEFTCEGMLQRVNAFIEKQDFCHQKRLWPPLSALQVKVAQPGQSCKHLCQESQLICEPTYFAHLNKEQDLRRHGVECDSAEVQNEVFVPALESGRKKCLLQGDYLLFSCAGSHDTHRRICPCRDYMKGQVALCRDCL